MLTPATRMPPRGPRASLRRAREEPNYSNRTGGTVAILPTPGIPGHPFWRGRAGRREPG